MCVTRVGSRCDDQVYSASVQCNLSATKIVFVLHDLSEERELIALVWPSPKDTLGSVRSLLRVMYLSPGPMWP